MSDDLTPAEHAAAIDETRRELIAFVAGCTDEQWLAAPVDGDPRPVGVICDHVAHAYEYLTAWVEDLLAGQSPEVDPDLVDGLNAGHAAQLGSVSREEVTEHLLTSGDILISVVGGLDPWQLTGDGGRVARFAVIASRHARSHREEIEEALGLTPAAPSTAQA
jgi:hypothetical protein